MNRRLLLLPVRLLSILGVAALYGCTPVPPQATAGQPPPSPRAGADIEESPAGAPTPAPAGLSIPHPSIANISFESAGEQGIPGWSTTSTGPANWTPSSNRARSGKISMRLYGQERKKEARITSSPVPVRGGDMVEFQGWVLADGPSAAGPAVWMEIATADGPWQPVEPRALGPLMRPDDFDIEWSWQPRVGCVMIPGDVTRARIVAACSTENQKGVSWYLDDLAFQVVSYADYAAKNATAPRLEDFTMALADTLAGGRLDGYGFKQGHTPNIRMLAAEGVLYENTFTAAPWTRPSIASIFTSLYPSQHTAELVNSPIPDRFTTLAEALKAKGYFTAAFVRTYFDGFIGPGTGYGQGFDLYYYSINEDEVFEAAKAFLDLNQETLKKNQGGGIFLLFHFFEPHSSYQNHFPGFLKNKGTMGELLMNETIDAIINRGEDPDKTNPLDMDYARACYDSELYFMDQRLGELIFRMKQLNLYDKMNIVFTADHGEAFGERPMIWNHCNPHGSTVQVPLILRFPGRTQPGRRESSQTTTLDIMPTLLAAANADIPGGCEGRNLLAQPPVEGKPYAVSEDKSKGIIGVGSLALREGRYKLAVWNASRRRDPEDWTSSEWVVFQDNSPAKYELFDLETDPNERTDISAENPAVFERLKNLLHEHCRRTGILNPNSPASKAPALSKETMQDLEAIGYLNGK